MQCEIGRLVRDVRVAIDRNRVGAAMLAVDVNTQLLDESIVCHVVDGVRLVLLSCGASLLEAPCSFASSAVEWLGDGAGRVLLPCDFLRFIAFGMDDWAYPVVVAEEELSAAYRMMKSPIKALRGVAARPRVFLISSGADKYLEFYSCCSEEAQVSVAHYIPLPLVADGMVDIPLLCYGAAVAQIGALVLLARGATELAAALQQEVQSLLGAGQ